MGEDALRLEISTESPRSSGYDCVVPISGGLDSVYTAFYLSRRMSLRCLGVHYDHGLGSESKPKMLEWIERETGMPIVVRRWDPEESRALVRDSVRALLPFGPRALQAGLCRHCGYGIRAAVYGEMACQGLPSVWGTHTMDQIPFRYCENVSLARLVLRGRTGHALKSLRGRYRQARALPSPGASPLRLLLSPLGYPAPPAADPRLKVMSFYRYIPWNKKRMLAELQAGGMDTEPLTNAHSDCRLPPIVDAVLRSAWTVGKKEVYVCNLVREGQLSTEEGIEQIDAMRRSSVDTGCLRDLGLASAEIEAMLRASGS
jgi:hypothetical protein